MQVGSLVKCKKSKPYGWKPEYPEIIPKKGIVYTVRAIFQRKEGTFLHFEEIVNSPRQYRNEFGETMFGIEGFLEVQPPVDVSALFADQLKINHENRLNK